MSSSNGGEMETLETAERFVDSGDFDAARAACQSLVIQDTASSADLVQVGHLYERMNDFGSAKESYTKAIMADPETVPGQGALGRLLLQEGDLDNAAIHLERAVQLDPGDPIKLTLLGVVRLDQGFQEKGLRHLESAVALDPSYEEAHFNLGLALRDSEPVRAEHHLRLAVDLDPAYGKAHRELGYVLSALHKTLDAERHLAEAWKCDPSDVWTLIYWGTAKWQTQDATGAREKFETAIKMEPDLSFPKWSLGALYEDLGEKSAARRYYEAALAVNPEDEIAAEKLHNLLAGKVPVQ